MAKKTFLSILFLLTFFLANAQYNKRYIYYMGQNSIVNKDYNNAINLLTILIEADTLSKEAYFLRAIAKYNVNDIVGAENDFSSAIRVNPVFVDAYQYRAITRSMMGNYNDALKDYAKALEIRPDYYSTYYSRGVTLFLNQQFKDAIADFDMYLQREPKSVDAYINRGTSYLMLQDTVKAYEDFNKAVEVAPRYSDAYLRRGNVLILQGEYDRALKDLETAIKYDEKNIPAYFNRALAYAYSNRPVQAIEDFSTIIKLDSTNSLSYFNRALLRSQIGDYNRALEDYDRVIQYSPSNVLVHYNRGTLNLRLGNLEEAFDDFSRAIELYPDFANAYLNRSVIRGLLADYSGQERDRRTAENKIAEYNQRFRDKNLSDAENERNARHYADTSKIFNSLLSFDSREFNGAKEDNVKDKSVDIALLPLYKFAVVKNDTIRSSFMKNNDADRFAKEVGADGLILTWRSDYAEDSESYETPYTKTWISMFMQGVQEFSMKQYTNAINYYNKAIADNPRNPFLYMNRSSAKYEMIEFISNLDSGEQSLMIGADKGKTLERTKRKYDYNEALSDIDRAISINPYVAQFHYNKANILCQSGDMPGAIEEYSKAIKLEPLFAEAYYNRGLIQIYLKDTKKGYLDISRAGELGLPQAYRKIQEYGSGN